MRIIEFLIFFPFAVALVLFAMGNSERVYEARKNLVKGAGLAIMAAVIYLAVRVLGGEEDYSFLTKAETANMLIMAGELVLMGVVIF